MCSDSCAVVNLEKCTWGGEAMDRVGELHPISECRCACLSKYHHQKPPDGFNVGVVYVRYRLMFNQYNTKAQSYRISSLTFTLQVNSLAWATLKPQSTHMRQQLQWWQQEHLLLLISSIDLYHNVGSCTVTSQQERSAFKLAVCMLSVRPFPLASSYSAKTCRLG